MSINSNPAWQTKSISLSSRKAPLISRKLLSKLASAPFWWMKNSPPRERGIDIKGWIYCGIKTNQKNPEVKKCRSEHTLRKLSWDKYCESRAISWAAAEIFSPHCANMSPYSWACHAISCVAFLSDKTAACAIILAKSNIGSIHSRLGISSCNCIRWISRLSSHRWRSQNSLVGLPHAWSALECFWWLSTRPHSVLKMMHSMNGVWMVRSVYQAEIDGGHRCWMPC